MVKEFHAHVLACQQLSKTLIQSANNQHGPAGQNLLFMALDCSAAGPADGAGPHQQRAASQDQHRGAHLMAVLGPEHSSKRML